MSQASSVETASHIRDQIRVEIEAIAPLDQLERETKVSVLSWIDSGAELFRTQKPATPDKHLVSYFPVVDGDFVLLVDHINAGLWLPTGGHVEPHEHPRATALREVQEELSITGRFLFDEPLLLTSTMTVGRTAGHTDVSLWYALEGDRQQDLVYDHSEFRSIRWFNKHDIPLDRADPQMHRFLSKLYPDNT